ncbi:transposase [Priestia flexa]|uniref:Transposase n=1 Tax=Priestia flexa TaxID=86664 RepID=A0ABU4J426_9BACI|nr:transposase [Priestia flexa]MDW8515756.1 transposase [Priestia flexa]
MFKDYNMNQVVLPLDLEIKLQENDIAFAVHHLVEHIPDEAFAGFLQKMGCPAYHPCMMMKIILCAYTQSVFSGRKIEALLKDSIRMMWLAQGYEPSYRTINRFRVHPEGQYTLAYDVFSNPTDTRTLCPFLDAIEHHYFELPDYIVAEPVFGYLKANLRFTRMSVRGKENVKNELGFAFMAVNVRKYIASSVKCA